MASSTSSSLDGKGSRKRPAAVALLEGGPSPKVRASSRASGPRDVDHILLGAPRGRGMVTTTASPRALKSRRMVTDPRCFLPPEGDQRREFYCPLLKARKRTVIPTLSDLPAML